MSLPVTKSCPECNAKLGWAYVVNGLYCSKCELLDVKFSSEPFPSLSDVAALHADEGYEIRIKEMMDNIFKKDILTWQGNEFRDLRKVKNFEDSFNTDIDEYIKQNFLENDIIPLDLESTDSTIRSKDSYINNPIMKYCFVEHLCSLGLQPLYRIYNNGIKDVVQNKYSDIFGYQGIISECINYLEKLKFIIDQKDQEFFENTILDHYYYGEKETPTVWRWSDGADKDKFVLRYRTSHKQIRLKVSQEKFIYSYIQNDRYFFDVDFFYKNNKIDIISFTQNRASEFYCSERLKKHIQEILDSHFPKLDLEGINTTADFDRHDTWELDHALPTSIPLTGYDLDSNINDTEDLPF